MKRPTILLIAAAVLVLLVGLLSWRYLSQLSHRIVDLENNVGELGEQLAEAEKKAEDAESRAEAAEIRADRAEEEADTAQTQADAADTRARESAQRAEEAELDRMQAEARELAAAEARRRAELEADREAAARAAAEERKAAAEKKQAELALEAERAAAEADRVRAENTRIRRRMERELNRLQRALSQIADTRRTALGLVMTLDSRQIEFDFDKSELRPENREVLSRIAGVLMTFQDYGIQIFGHTDDVGSAEYNQRLSEARAAAVLDYLVQAGIDRGVLSTMGLGERSPLAEGTDPESRQRNRRVELAIVFSEGEYEALADEPAGPEGDRR